MHLNLNAADIRTPAAAATFLAKLGAVLGDIAGEAEQFRANQQADGVSGKPIAFLQAIHDQLSASEAELTAAAVQARAHANKIGDTIGARPDLVGTQAGGGYTDTTAL